MLFIVFNQMINICANIYIQVYHYSNIDKKTKDGDHLSIKKTVLCHQPSFLTIRVVGKHGNKPTFEHVHHIGEICGQCDDNILK